MRYLTGKFERKPQNKIEIRPGTPDFSLRDMNLEAGSVGEDPFRGEIIPDDLPLHRPLIAQRIGLILVLLVLAAASWFCFLGPGSTLLEANLKKLAVRASVPPVFTFTPSETPSQTSVAQFNESTPTIKPVTPTNTIDPSPTNTFTETVTSTSTVESSPTPIPVQYTPTPTSEVAGCVPADLITLADVGKNVCVSGRVFRTIDKASSFIIVVVEEPQAFYFVAYDLKFENLEKKQCIFATGEIRQLVNNPIMVLSYSTPLQYCP